MGEVVELGSSYGAHSQGRPELYATLKVGDKVLSSSDVEKIRRSNCTPGSFAFHRELRGVRVSKLENTIEASIFTYGSKRLSPRLHLSLPCWCAVREPGPRRWSSAVCTSPQGWWNPIQSQRPQIVALHSLAGDEREGPRGDR